MNKKIRNSTKVEFNGISFKSKQEFNVYKLFLDNGLELSYEPEKIKLQEDFKININYFEPNKSNKKVLVNNIGKKILPITYSPDFELSYKGIKYFIEVKGFANDVFPLKKKMFLNEINNYDNVVYAVIYNLSNAKDLIEIIKNT